MSDNSTITATTDVAICFLLLLHCQTIMNSACSRRAARAAATKEPNLKARNKSSHTTLLLLLLLPQCLHTTAVHGATMIYSTAARGGLRYVFSGSNR
jgi:hypothetical protein